jgi:HAD superfamily hydrolase (TIGR01509 family)
MTVCFDIGSTLIDGPPSGPARRIAEALKIGGEKLGELECILFRTPARDPDELADQVSKRIGVEREAAVITCRAIWEAQLVEAFVMPGARSAIRSLDLAGVPRAYLSNIWPPFYAHFEKEFADEVAKFPQFLSFRTGLMKPDPAFFLLAIHSLALRPDQVVMVGDTYENDIRPAIALGIRTIWVLHRPEKEKRALIEILGGASPAPDLTIPSIGDLQVSHIRLLESRETQSYENP